MPTFKVTLAESPTRVMNALASMPRSWEVLRDQYGATSYDMNLLGELGFVERIADQWLLTAEGRASLRPASHGKAGSNECP